MQFRADITFHCTDSWSVPRRISTDNECSLKIMWPSPAGCPMHKSKNLQVDTQECKIGDRSTNFLYHFKADQNYYLASNTKDIKFALKPCGSIQPTKQLPESCWGKSVCLFQSDLSIASFEDTPNVTRSLEGHFEKVYKARILGCSEYTIRIRFFCKNYPVTERGPYLSSSGKCSTTIDWQSMAACPLHSRPTCLVKGPNNAHIYDLTPLIVPSNTYSLPLPNGHFREIHMDICSIVGRSNEFGTENGALLKYEQITVESQATTEYYDFDKVEEKRLLLEYIDYQQCPSDPTQKLTFKIEMVCSTNVHHSRPIYLKTEGCVHYAIWPHVAGCQLGEVAPMDCSVRHPTTGHTYSLEKLRGKTFSLHLPDTNGLHIELHVCKPLTHSPTTSCGQNVGACLVGDKGSPVSLGLVNSGLEVAKQSLMLKYTWGDKCPSLLDDRHTTIIFECGLEDSGPRLMSNLHNCSYSFTWVTPLACQLDPEKDSEEAFKRNVLTFILSFLGFLLAFAGIMAILTCIPKTRDAFLAFYKKCSLKANNEKDIERNSESAKPLHSCLERP